MGIGHLYWETAEGGTVMLNWTQTPEVKIGLPLVASWLSCFHSSLIEKMVNSIHKILWDLVNSIWNIIYFLYTEMFIGIIDA